LDVRGEEEKPRESQGGWRTVGEVKGQRDFMCLQVHVEFTITKSAVEPNMEYIIAKIR